MWSTGEGQSARSDHFFSCANTYTRLPESQRIGESWTPPKEYLKLPVTDPKQMEII